MTHADVVAAAGPDADPDAVGGPDPETCDEFRPSRAPEGMLVMIEDGRLARISISKAGIRTDRGFGIGATASAIKAAYGAGASATPHQYLSAQAEYITVWTTDPNATDARGIVYETGPDGLVISVLAGGPSIQYVEGCV